MTDTAPLVRKYKVNYGAVAAGSDAENDVFFAEFAGTLTAARLVSSTAITGANTDSRTISVVNKGQSGSGTTVMATKAFTSGVSSTADNDTVLTLSSTAADLVIAAGDVIVVQSNHVGSTGLADPGALVELEVTRS